MKKKILFLIIIIYINKIINIIKLKLINNLHRKEISLKICICTLGKKENRYIKEFVEYYEKYGVDKIFLYDNNDNDEERFEEVIGDYINKGFVKLINWRGKRKQLYNIMNDCYLNNYKLYDWLIFYEIDEYINLKNYSNIKTFLNESKFKKCSVIYLNWIIHTDNNLMTYDNRTLHERFPIIDKYAKTKKKNYKIPVKSILKGNISNITINCVHTLNSKLKSCNGFGLKPNLDLYFMKNPDYEYYYIDHYYCKSVEEFIEKINKGCAMQEDSVPYKIHRINRYFDINEINIEKITYIENKTGLNLLSYKLKLKKMLNKI